MAVNTSIECVIARPDIAELAAQVRTELSKRLLGGAPVLPLSSEDILSFVMAGTTNLMYGYITQSLKEQDPEFMCCDNLVAYAIRRGIYLLGATRSKGYVAITGDPHTPIPANIRFFGESSRDYKLDPGVTFNPVELDAGGGAVVRITASIPGAIFNLAAGNTLVTGAVTPGIDAEVTVVGNGLTGGTYDETCEDLRRRVIAAEAAGLISINEAWFLSQTLSYPGVTRACTDAEGACCCDPTWITIYPFMEGVYGEIDEAPYGVPPCSVLEAMTLWMFGREVGRGQGLAPIGIRGRYQEAFPLALSITAQCFRGCPMGAVDRIRAAVVDYFRYSHCVGATLCKDQLRTVIYRAIGQDPCMSNVQFHYDHDSNGVRYEDDASIYLQCGWFFVTGDITLNEGPLERSRTLPSPVTVRPMPALAD